MKRLLVLLMAIAVGCGTEPERTQDSRLYGKWLFAGIDLFCGCCEPPQSLGDLLYEFTIDSIISTGTGVEYVESHLVGRKDTVEIVTTGRSYDWHTSNGEVFVKQNITNVGVFMWAVKYEISGYDTLTFLLSRQKPPGMDWSGNSEIRCNREAIRQVEREVGSPKD